ncbi:MAG: hypothetical protein ACI4D7_00020 [Lachnospiraceae bacterium]
MAESSKGTMETVGFRRFLSYIYAYENGRKLRNAGFVKVEIREQRMKVQVAVNGIYQKGGRPVELFLIDDREKRIKVGEISLLNGHGEFRSSTNTENVWNSGYTFSQICGICLQGAGNRNQFYMTLWKDVKREALKEEPKEKEERKPEMIYVAPAPKEETRSEENEEKTEETLKTEECKEESKEWKKEESGELSEGQRTEETEEEPQEQKAETDEEEPDVQKTKECEEELEVQKAVLHAAEVEKTESLILWKKLCSRYPHVDIRPVISNTEASQSGRHICEVLRIRPSDIGRLPRNNWILAQNQFVRQAYSRFRQIFLLRMEDKNSDGQDENQWFMGVPGENSEQERALAKIFGFTDYFPCRNGGFWYTKIYMGE